MLGVFYGPFHWPIRSALSRPRSTTKSACNCCLVRFCGVAFRLLQRKEDFTIVAGLKGAKSVVKYAQTTRIRPVRNEVF